MTDAKEVFEPVFVSEEQAEEFREQHDLDDEFPSSGWYFQVVTKNVESEYEGVSLGSLDTEFFGPYETEEQALLDIPRKVPGVFVKF